MLLAGLLLGSAACGGSSRQSGPRQPGTAGATGPHGAPTGTTRPEPEVLTDTITVPIEARSGANLSGRAVLVQRDGGVDVHIEIEGAPPGPHGVHIHQVADCSAPDATSAGEHFDPDGEPHGLPEDAYHHAGDLGNVTVDANGHGELRLFVPGATLERGYAKSLVGRALIVHAAPDDGRSQPSGNSGERIGCAEIVVPTS
jgi:Cu-Zn family superoxide dismutase